jgi:BolA protein
MLEQAGGRMTSVQATIAHKLAEALSPLHLEVHNESHMHNVPPGSESHFKVLVVAEQFTSQRLLERHRAVHTALREELAGAVHALSIHAFTPDEWFERGGTVPASPPCRGGSATGT